MTKTKKQTKINKYIIIPITIVLIIAVATVACLLILKPNNNETDTGSSTPTHSTENSEKPENTDIITEDPLDDKDDDTPIQYDGSDPNTAENLSAVIEYHGLQGDYYVINIGIPQYLSSGTCTLNLSGINVITDIEALPSTSACSFRIERGQLSSGKHSLVIDIDSNGRKGQIKEEINVNL